MEKGLQFEDYLQIGNLTFNQLAELRHRGAFSTVSRTFAACCTASARSIASKNLGLPWKFYQVCSHIQ